jgi:MFS family permease
LIIYLAACIGLALCDSYAELLVLRAVQSSGSSATIALANAVAADICVSSERGKYVAYTSVTSILAPSVAPVLGGVLSQYAGWRWIFWFCALLAVTIFTPFLLFFPETCRVICGNGSIPPPLLNHSLISHLRERRWKKQGRDDVFAERDARAKERKIRFPNPLETLRIIFTRVAGFTLLCNGILFCCYYAVISSLPSQFKEGYGLDDLQISLMFLPFAAGGFVSAFTSGHIIDWNFGRHCRNLGLPILGNRQQDLTRFPIERARLEVAIPLVVLGSGALLAYGWLISYRVQIAGPCIFLFLIGYSITASFNCMAILMIDMYPGKPATATAANNLVRCEMGAGAAALVVPLANRVGFGWTATIAAAIWTAFVGVLIMLVVCGPRWRREAREKM